MNWSVLQHTGRETKLMFEGTEELALEEYEKAKTNPALEGTIVLERDGKIVKQSYGFVSDDKRWGKTIDGKPYRPEIREVGHPVKDLSFLADIIKQMPETDPDLDLQQPSEQQPPEQQPSEQQPPEQQPSEQSKWRDFDYHNEIETKPNRLERMVDAPCGRNGLLTFFIVLNHYMSEHRSKIKQAQSKEKRFLFELGIRLLSGSPICGSTVKAAFNDTKGK